MCTYIYIYIILKSSRVIGEFQCANYAQTLGPHLSAVNTHMVDTLGGCFLGPCVNTASQWSNVNVNKTGFQDQQK